MGRDKKGCVYLVGAGCGAEDLITVRGLNRLQNCDVVIYDDLIADRLLKQVPKGTEKIYMGKREGRHSKSQEEICAALAEKAKEGKKVVRLKGGDPFVFGRGGEEILALQKEGIPYEEIPGISSAIAIPAEAGIPVTHRGKSRSFHVITAHTADTDDGLPNEFDYYAKLNGTLVFLMGLKQLPCIAERLMKAGMAADTPAAVVSGGNAKRHVAIRGILSDIVERTEQEHVCPPAVVVVGDVAELNLSGTIGLDSETFSDRISDGHAVNVLPETSLVPLVGVTVAITGTDTMLDKLETGLSQLGAEVFVAERSKLKKIPVEFSLKELGLIGKHWLVFTSSNGVERFFEEMKQQKTDIRSLHNCRLAVIGAATGEKLAEYGVYADLCPEHYTSQALGEALLQAAGEDEDVYLFRSAQGSKPLYEMLSEKFRTVDVPIYDLEPDATVIPDARKKLAGADYVTFASASGVELFMKAYGAVPEQAACVCIGEVTADALKKYSARNILMAADISAAGIVGTILQSGRG